ncbi:twin-arginine translocation signal domain-containing protein [Defluviimonas sp. SAOS-178_SWC]|uniref:twin-arginine translocation signal domain-containing protein n=1 Tax=Defluviimonas sp. SAOS-178_SWC TaxID=3121287 RepID=UPI0032213E1A
MGKTVETEKTSRRDFLKLATTAAPAAAAATALGAAPAAADTEAKGSGLQDTAHIRAYYDSARF